MKVGYVRVSELEQHEGLQVDTLKDEYLQQVATGRIGRPNYEVFLGSIQRRPNQSNQDVLFNEISNPAAHQAEDIKHMRGILANFVKGDIRQRDMLKPDDMATFLHSETGRSVLTFDEQAKTFLNDIEKHNGGEKRKEYEKALDIFGKTVYGKQWEYLQQIRQLEDIAKQRAIKQQPDKGIDQARSANRDSAMVEQQPQRPDANMFSTVADELQRRGNQKLADELRQYVASQAKQEAAVQSPAAEVEKKQYEVAGDSKPSDRHPEHNEDLPLQNAEHGFFGVMDGMGGTTGGEVAASIAGKQINDALVHMHQMYPQLNAAQAEQAFREGFDRAQIEMALKSQESPELADMGSVVIAGQLVQDSGEEKLVYAQAGDARLYVVKEDGTLVKITEDEANPLIKFNNAEGKIDNAATQADINDISELWRLRNQVTNCVDVKRAKPTIGTYDIQPDDLMVLATSDGIHDNLTPGEIQRVIAGAKTQSQNLQDIPKELVAGAQVRSRDRIDVRHKPDDMTAVVLKIHKH